MNGPSTNGSFGRDSRGRFVPGNPGGPGHPLCGRIARLRAALVAAVTPDDIATIARGLVKSAIAGDIDAARLLLSFALGPPIAQDILERVEECERLLLERGGAAL